MQHLRGILRQRASDQRPNDTTELRNTLTNSNQEWALHKWRRGSDDGECSILQACGAHALHCSSNDEHLRRGSNTAQQRAEFEETEEAQEDPFVLEVDVDFAGQGLQSCAGELVSRTVPAYICQ